MNPNIVKLRFDGQTDVIIDRRQPEELLAALIAAGDLIEGDEVEIVGPAPRCVCCERPIFSGDWCAMCHPENSEMSA